MTKTLELKKESEMADEFLEHSEKQADDQEKQARELLKKVEADKDKKCGDEINAVLAKYNRFFDVTFSYTPQEGLKKTIILLKKEQ